MKTALVTGGGGFLGGAIVTQLLKAGWKVRSIGRSPQPENEKRGVEVIRGDLKDLDTACDATRDIDCVFHVAAKAGVWGSWESYFLPNVVATRNILAGCRENKVRRLVYTSTPSVVFNRHAFSGENELLPYGRDWLCNYAHTKAIAEEEVLRSDESQTLHTVALRPHLIWGKGDPHIVPRIIERARAGKLRIIGDGKNRVDITHVENAAHAHLLAAKALEETPAIVGGNAYFISQGEPVVLWDWINNLLRQVGIPPLEKKMSLGTAYRLGAAMEFAYRTLMREDEPPMTRFVAMELAKDHWFDISAAKRDLHYEPIVNSAEGMDALIESLQSTIEKGDQ